MCKLHCIFLHGKVILESKGFVKLWLVILIVKIIFFIVDIEAFPLPTLLRSPLAQLRSNYRLHALVVEGFRFVLNLSQITRFTMLNLAMKLLILLCTLKLNHWVKPFVLISFWRIKSYVCLSTFIKGKLPCKLPLDWKTSSWHQR